MAINRVLYEKLCVSILMLLFLIQDCFSQECIAKGRQSRQELKCLRSGGKEIRTLDRLRAKQVLYRLSYTPIYEKTNTARVAMITK